MMPTYDYWLSEILVHGSAPETGQVDPVEALLVPERGSTENHMHLAPHQSPPAPCSCDVLRGCLRGPQRPP